MQQSLEFIVLGTTKVGENALVVHTLSREYGRRGFLVRSAKKAGTALFLPLNILEADVRENPRSELWTLSGITLRDPLSGIRSRLDKSAVTLFLSEVLFRVLRDGANEDGLYEWCVGSILTYNALEADYANYHMRFLLDLAAALGFRPTLADVAPFAEKHLPKMQALLSASFSDCMLLPFSGAERSALCEDLVQYLAYHTDQSLTLRSLPVLRDLFR